MKKIIYLLVIIVAIILQGCVTGSSEYSRDHFSYTNTSSQDNHQKVLQDDNYTTEQNNINVENFNGGIIGTDIFTPTTTEIERDGENTIINNYYLNNNYDRYWNWYPSWRRGIYVSVGWGWDYYFGMYDPWFSSWYYPYYPYYPHYCFDPYAYYYRPYHYWYPPYYDYYYDYKPHYSDYVASPRSIRTTSGATRGTYTTTTRGNYTGSNSNYAPSTRTSSSSNREATTRTTSSSGGVGRTTTNTTRTIEATTSSTTRTDSKVTAPKQDNYRSGSYNNSSSSSRSSQTSSSNSRSSYGSSGSSNNRSSYSTPSNSSRSSGAERSSAGSNRSSSSSSSGSRSSGGRR